MIRFLRLSGGSLGILLAFWQPAQAADGFDNNYVGGDANQLFVTVNGVNRAVLFGPGLMSVGSFFIDIPNDSVNDQGVVNSFVLSGATSYLRSAYFDRVISTTLYYRVYLASGPAPGWNTLALQSQSPLIPGTCYTATQNNTWSVTQSINLVQGLSGGDYVLEFYVQSELYDVGLEDGSCTINALEQCNTNYDHPGRYITSRFNTTDPAACNLPAILAGMSNPSKMKFHLNAPLPLEWTYFRGKLRQKSVLLQWGTAQEQDMETFSVERSTDGLDWTELTTLAAAGRSTVPQTYACVDERPRAGWNYYRLKARSTDGGGELSATVAVDNPEAALSLWPNPAGEVLCFSLTKTEAEPLTVRAVNSLGQVFPVPVSDRHTLAVDGLAAGTYALEMCDRLGHRIAVGRFIKTD